MPFTGGASPSPERYGGAPGGAPLLRRVYESIAAQRGDAYDQSWPPTSIVGIENLAIARAIVFDGYGANERLANNFLPAKMTAVGLLPRWEKIFAVPPLPGDTEPVRRARVAAAFLRIGQPNSVQSFLDVVQAALGPIYVGITHFTPINALSWWPGNNGSAGAITSFSGGLVTVSNLTNVPSAAYGNNITLSNCANAANDGTFTITSSTSTSVTARNAAGVSPDNGVGGAGPAPTIQWSITNPFVYWYSTVDMIDIQVDPTVAGYHNADGSPNGVFWATLNSCAAVIDQMLPADKTWNFWMASPQNPGTGLAHMGFYLDEPDADLEALDS